MISVISDWVLATVRSAGWFAVLISVELILWVCSIRSCAVLVVAAGYNEADGDRL
jgi:nitrogen fixation protein FixH